MKIKIDKGVPPPNGGLPRGGLWALMRQMKVGDSILVPGEFQPHNVRMAAQQCFGSRNYSTRPEPGGLRVWRLK